MMDCSKYMLYTFVMTALYLQITAAARAEKRKEAGLAAQPLKVGDEASLHDLKMSQYMEPRQGSTFIFEIKERDRQCFHEDFHVSHSFILEYKVLAGGSLDIDVFVIGPGGEDIYTGRRKKQDAIVFPTTPARNFSFCFSNRFSTMSKKKVYFSLQAKSQATLSAKLGIRKPTVLTALEATQEEIYEYLLEVIESQKEYRLSEAVDSNYARNLNEKVGWLATMCTIAMVLTGIGQTVVLKYFFTQYGSSPRKI
ncbi:transmembrane emp24 domain-containing protein 3-like [Amphiura filiformis]|uniref:transmembrane emp24 domain-containing protein 3-like n=1 Tax=Amphiura filiformis TaxID=82378 RepID=UPI003B21A295